MPEKAASGQTWLAVDKTLLKHWEKHGSEWLCGTEVLAPLHCIIWVCQGHALRVQDRQSTGQSLLKAEAEETSPPPEP